MCSLSRSFNRVNSRVETSIDEHKQACVEKNGKFACNYFPTGGEKHSNQTGQLAKIYKYGGLILETENAIYKIIPLPIIPMRISVLSKIDLLKIKTPTSGDEQD